MKKKKKKKVVLLVFKQMNLDFRVLDESTIIISRQE